MLSFAPCLSWWDFLHRFFLWEWNLKRLILININICWNDANSRYPFREVSRPEVFCKKGVLRNFTKFTGKHLCQSLFFNKVEALRTAALLQKRPWHRCFLANFAKFHWAPFYKEHTSCGCFCIYSHHLGLSFGDLSLARYL